MSIYQVIRIAGGTGYKVHVKNASSVVRVIGIFPSEADAVDWIAIDQKSRSATPVRWKDHADRVLLETG